MSNATEPQAGDIAIASWIERDPEGKYWLIDQWVEYCEGWCERGDGPNDLEITEEQMQEWLDGGQFSDDPDGTIPVHGGEIIGYRNPDPDDDDYKPVSHGKIQWLHSLRGTIYFCKGRATDQDFEVEIESHEVRGEIGKEVAEEIEQDWRLDHVPVSRDAIKNAARKVLPDGAVLICATYERDEQ